jgi:hypothetical protein
VFGYLRFVRDTKDASDNEDVQQGPWRPMGGTYEGWPRTAAELKVLDPSCGSGHFLVAAFDLLVRLRMHEESLSVEAAVEAVLSDNLFGLEIDPRCTQIAAFNVAMAVWKHLGPKPLPPMRNIACSGIPLGNSRDEWMKSLKVALPNSDLGFQWGQLYDMFSKADTLGSLINPRRFFGSGLISDQQLEQISDALSAVIANDRNATEEQHELSAAAQGLTRATELLAGHYSLVITNVPYLGRGKQCDELRNYIDTLYAPGKADLSTAFLLRCLEFCCRSGSTALVTPQNWLFLSTYEDLRKLLLETRQLNVIARLGANAFQDMNWWAATTALEIITATAAEDKHHVFGIDVSEDHDQAAKSEMLLGRRHCPIQSSLQSRQLQIADTRIIIGYDASSKLMSAYASSNTGLQTGDNDRFSFLVWELPKIGGVWKFFQRTPEAMTHFDGCIQIVRWADGKLAEESGSVIRGINCVGKLGVLVHRMNKLNATLYTGEIFDQNGAVLLPQDLTTLVPIWCYVTSADFHSNVRVLDTKTGVTPTTFEKVPFNLKHWQHIACEKYPNGLPEPESDDPTQWLFHGRPDESIAPLQVAVARLLSYRWPAEINTEMRLSQRARELVASCSELDEFVDDDGIVCIPSVRGEEPASDRLLRLLHVAGVNHSENLESWLRDKFFQEHCELFHQRPFIWHIWDGKKDGFAALVNYHKLTGPQGKKLLENLTFSYLGDWITRQEAAVKHNESGADDRLLAAKELQGQLEAILHGEPPYDIFVRWKPIHEQPIGWTPDINDGVRMNIRPFMLAELSRGRRGAGVLRFPPKIKWTKDRGKET